MGCLDGRHSAWVSWAKRRLLTPNRAEKKRWALQFVQRALSNTAMEFVTQFNQLSRRQGKPF
tara:strand:- start:3307 stop:3492 length:186 start_codon:yes stop_codon:yes gene_type:complete